MKTRSRMAALAPWMVAVLLAGPAASRGSNAGGTDDRFWSGEFGLPVPDRDIRAAVEFQGELLMGGWFEQIGRLRSPWLAAWNGTAWREIGGPGPLEALAIHQGRVLAAGVGFVARWDGSSWESGGPVTASVEGTVEDVAVHGDSILIGGRFRSVAGVSARNVALWDGSQWRALGTVDLDVTSVTWFRNTIHAAGIASPGSASGYVVAWDGSTWSPVGSSTTRAFHGVLSLAVHQDELFAAGEFDDLGGLPISVVGRWNGSKWQPLPGVPSASWATALAVLDGTLHIGGGFDFPGATTSVARWDGVQVGALPDVGSPVLGFAFFQGERNVYGGFTGPVDTRLPLGRVAVWRRGEWRDFAVPGPGMKGLWGPNSGRPLCAAVWQNRVVVGGDFTFCGRENGWTRCRGVALWNGAAWESLGTPGFASVRALAVHQGDLYAAGTWAGPAPDREVARWSGTDWQSVGSISGEVLALVSYGGDLVAGGRVLLADGQIVSHLIRWDGSRWHDLDGGVAGLGTAVFDLELHSGDLAVGGAFQSAGGVACANIALWNPVEGFRPLGDGLDSYPFRLLSLRDTLYATGDFHNAGGIPADRLARWGGGEWSAMGTGTWAPSWMLASYRGQVVAAPGSVPGPAVWDGAEWHSLGSGVEEQITMLEAHGGELWVGGTFRRAGDKRAYGIARWSGAVPAHPPPGPEPLQPLPNPSQGPFEITYEVPSAGRIHVRILDLAGRTIATPLDRYQPAGRTRFVWNPSPSLPAGIYFLRIDQPGGSAEARLIRVR